MCQCCKHLRAVGDEQQTTTQLPDEEELQTSEGLVVVSPSQVQEPQNCRNYLRNLFSCNMFQNSVICLVILDAVLVLFELLMYLSVIKPDQWRIAPQVFFHSLSLALLSFFILELVGKIYAYQIQFFKYPFELVDGTVIIVSFVLEIVYIIDKEAFTPVGLLILVRLWRVARVINGVLNSANRQSHREIQVLTETNKRLVLQINEIQQRTARAEEENI